MFLLTDDPALNLWYLQFKPFPSEAWICLFLSKIFDDHLHPVKLVVAFCSARQWDVTFCASFLTKMQYITSIYFNLQIVSCFILIENVHISNRIWMKHEAIFRAVHLNTHNSLCAEGRCHSRDNLPACPTMASAGEWRGPTKEGCRVSL